METIKVRIPRKEMANILFKEGVSKENIVLNILKYKLEDNGTLYNFDGKKVGSPNRQGYLKVQVTLCGKVKDIFIHRLQAFKKYGKKMFEQGIMVRHLNGIKSDNSLDNIAIGTVKDNYNDMPEHIRIKSQKSATQASKKYPDDLVIKIKEYHAQHKSYKKTMQKYNISSRGTLYYILKKR